MTVSVHLIDGPLPDAPPPALIAGAGAVLTFDGVVRPLEAGRELLALDYEVYTPMALAELARLARDTASAHGLIALEARHSRGRVPVGACSFRITIHAAHRAPALTAAADFIDRLKRDIPIWKHPVWSA